jgi:hypothetical protein
MTAIDLIGNIMGVDHPADVELAEVMHHASRDISHGISTAGR